MKKKSSILEALCLYDQEKILDLCKILLEKKIPLKKAAGEDILFSSPSTGKSPIGGAFEKSQQKKIERQLFLVPSEEEVKEKKKKKKEEEEDFRLNSELIMWQREASKEIETIMKKTDAVKGYKQNNQLYVVKKETKKGESKLKFASTHGVLVDKKQN